MNAHEPTGKFQHKGGFDSAFEHMEVTKIENGRAEAKLVVTQAVANSYGTLHGGAIATLIDIGGTMALLSVDAERGGVSVEINTSFLAAAKLGETVRVEADALKVGRSLGFTEVKLINEGNGKVIATGRHTKAL